MKNATTPANGEAMPATADADLIRLGAELEAAWAVQDEAERADGDEGASFDRAYEACRTISERIIEVPAATLDGMRVKARVVAWCHSGEPFADDSFDGASTDLRMVASLLRDLVGTEPRS